MEALAQPASDQPNAGAVTIVDGQVLTPEEAAAREEALKILQESPYMAMVFAAQADQNVVNVSTDQQFYDVLVDKSKKDKNGTTIVLGNNISLTKIFTDKKVNIKSGVKIENPRTSRLSRLMDNGISLILVEFRLTTSMMLGRLAMGKQLPTITSTFTEQLR